MTRKVRHIERGTEYEVVAYGMIQTDRPLVDYNNVVVYKDNNGMVWVRPSDEFEDPDRFEEIDT